ncbi:Smr/MutS family protein [Tropicibacter oceani]|uniref:Smr/MutS family protein n=1 Tax=Tropicibacter oceani TaxID=3058420 RepID=A0ABY8QIW4_9RHOB|nr:Smr/MutS family protein [Tropicibacter oceani]WGW04574.1 Smr/MutS family protein [Tropicibacter oceani]
MTRRRVRPEELELWQQIAKSADPLHKRPKPVVRAKPKKPGKITPPPAPSIPSFNLGDMAQPHTETHVFPKTTSQRLKSEPVQMDNKSFTRLKRGKLAPEARIDLHGMTLDQAHPALSRFIMTSHARGMRLVLVITGKGSREDPYDPMPHRRGVLKRQVPMWLRQPPISQAVLQVAEAHIKHGGSGAYYVYLRRSR